MKIAIDIDGVLADTMPALNNFYNKKFGTNFKLEDYRYHDLEKTWGCTKEEAVKIVEAFYASPDFLRILPVLLSQQAIKRLSKKNELFGITSRPESIKEITDAFINKYFDGLVQNILHTGQYASFASKINKASICEEERADIIIEDCLETAIECAQQGFKTFLLNSPQNQLKGDPLEDELPKKMIRAKNWNEILEHLK